MGEGTGVRVRGGFRGYPPGELCVACNIRPLVFQSPRTMTEPDYQQRKRELEARHQIALRFLQHGYEAQLRALELEWEREKETPAPAAAPEAASVPRPRPEIDLLEQVREALARLPRNFT